jgi:hypothetical protein
VSTTGVHKSEKKEVCGQPPPPEQKGQSADARWQQEQVGSTDGVRGLYKAECGLFVYLFISSELSRSSAPALHCSPRSPTRADPPGVSAGGRVRTGPYCPCAGTRR